MNGGVRVVLADDSVLLRDGLVRLLEDAEPRNLAGQLLGAGEVVVGWPQVGLQAGVVGGISR